MLHTFENKPTAETAAIHPNALGCGHDDTATSKLNDATVYGDLGSEAAQKVLATELITGFAPRAPKSRGIFYRLWLLISTEIGAIVMLRKRY